MVDIHSHILPGIDDGAQSWDTACAMVRMAYEDGTRHMVATPHANDEFRYDRAYSLELLARLNDTCGVPMRLSLGCDFHFSIENVESALLQPHHYCIGVTDYLLVEFSDFGVGPFASDALLRILALGITPIITHPERNPVLQGKPEQVREFAESGCLVQVTANSITGAWGDRARRSTEWLFEKDCVHIVASDAHDLKRRPPILSKAHKWISRHYGKERAERVCSENPRAVVENRPL